MLRYFTVPFSSLRNIVERMRAEKEALEKAIRKQPLMTSAKFSDFWTPSPPPPLSTFSRNLPYGPPLLRPPLSANVINGSPLRDKMAAKKPYDGRGGGGGLA